MCFWMALTNDWFFRELSNGRSPTIRMRSCTTPASYLIWSSYGDRRLGTPPRLTRRHVTPLVGIMDQLGRVLSNTSIQSITSRRVKNASEFHAYSFGSWSCGLQVLSRRLGRYVQGNRDRKFEFRNVRSSIILTCSCAHVEQYVIEFMFQLQIFNIIVLITNWDINNSGENV